MTELGILRGHMARQNPQAKAMVDSATLNMPPGTTGGVQLKDEVLVLFTGPVHHYVTPKFYTDTKPATGKVVPTWNYAAVQAYGRATVYFDSGVASTEYLSHQISDLSQHAETAVMGYTEGDKKGPWKVSDPPTDILRSCKKPLLESRLTSPDSEASSR